MSLGRRNSSPQQPQVLVALQPTCHVDALDLRLSGLLLRDAACMQPALVCVEEMFQQDAGFSRQGLSMKTWDLYGVLGDSWDFDGKIHGIYVGIQA